MESTSVSLPHTPPRATSAGPSPPRRNLMEDADSSVKRKRPRLDSGERTRRSMSADPLTSSSFEPAFTPRRGQTSTTAAREIAVSTLTDRTPSKVTINVRDPAQSGPSAVPVTNGTQIPISRDTEEAREPIRTEPPAEIQPQSSEVISVASSPTRSPEIEVAEVEDINEEPGQTKWRPLTNVMDWKDLQESLMKKFPYTAGGRDVRETVRLLAQAFEKQSLEDGEILKSVTHWIERYLQKTEPLDSQWWDMYLEERDFWEEIPALVEGLIRRANSRYGASLILPPRNDENVTYYRPLEDFLVAFSALAYRMALIDNQTLHECAADFNVTSDLISHRYMTNLVAIISPTGCPLWKGLYEFCHFNARPIINSIITRFAGQPGSGIACLSQIIRGLLHRSQSTPSLTQRLWIPLTIVNRIMHHHNASWDTSNEMQKIPPPILQHLPFEAYDVFQAVDTTLQTFVSKQVSALSLETCQTLVQQLSSLLLSVSVADQEPINLKLRERLGLILEFDNGLGPSIIELAWKFQFLKKCIFEGRMEIRVQGVETMQQELVAVYNKYVQRNNPYKDHPIAQYLSDFMLANRLVEYFVGVESHPQLIGRCGNIIGFLVITSRYSEAESDAIWKAVTTSPDSRIVDAILPMLMGFFNISPYDTLLYLTTKLVELPLQAYDSIMIMYGRALLEHLRRTWKDQRPDGRLDMPPYHLCIRLIRQSTAETSISLHRSRDIHIFALTELQSLLHLGPSDSDRRLIYEECVNDILYRTPYATGSFSAIKALLARNPEGDIKMLADESDLTNLVIKDFAHVIDIESSSTSAPQTFDESLTVRLELLQSIIILIPDTITAEAGQRLWEVTVGGNALNDRVRQIAWSILSKAIRSCQKRNSFIDRCIGDYLPRLDSRFITAGCLSFVQQVTHYELRLAHVRLDAPGDQISSLANELLWHISLVAPSGGIELEAIHMLVALCLDTPKPINGSPVALEAMQIDVVKRCIGQLKTAALKLKSYGEGTSSGEDEPMVVVVSDEEINSSRKAFTRSLLILKEFVQGVRSRPRYSPPPSKKPPIIPEVHDIKGESFQIRYQSFSGGTNTGIHSIEIGDLETMEDLSRRLVALTGFAKFTAIAGGQKLDLIINSNTTLREMKFDQKGLLIVKKSHGENSPLDLAPTLELRPLELEVLKNFSDLYQLLNTEENLAKEVFDFLMAFPPHESITTTVCAEGASLDVALSLGTPFKTLYSVYALKVCLLHQLQNGTASQGFISHGARILIAALVNPGIFSENLETEEDQLIAACLVECLLRFLKEPVTPEEAEEFLPDASSFVDRLQSLMHVARKGSSIEAHNLVCNCFAAILEASMQRESVWDLFKSKGQCSNFFQKLLLADSMLDIRQGIADSVRGICCTLPTSSTPPSRDFALFFWENLVSLIPGSLHHRDTAQQFFDISLFVFRSIDEISRDELDFNKYIKDWSELLLRHKPDEFVGRDSIDCIVFGLTGLLQWCIQLTKSRKQPQEIESNLMENIFHAHLFPQTSQPNENNSIQPRVPTLHSKTRQDLYSIILALVNDMDGYEKLLELVKELLPQGEDSVAWTWGVAQIVEEYGHDTNWTLDRSKIIRSPTGYPGLRNLSNTCYLNSLFTQLFMNIGFRSFIFDANIADIPSQRLLFETKNLFAFMQESMFRSIDPQGIADSMTTFENSLIDVSIQMDVDEFFNLLFDRWERQILADEEKSRFRKFYGGQIVQQIKSKECPHISETLEPFSAIQCDVQGKASLIESLNAYVGGEVMEGANKYSCTSCSCYVDAVKRACLRDIPDNLIFHLKRFEFDVMTGMRSKINDRFEFPQVIDMSPYHIDHLRDPEQSSPGDMFELVGILVHSGTTESGHYYSYIRERPVSRSQNPTWVEFNDADVSRFDPANIPDQCFGGPSDTSPFSPVRFAKAWNAYMLFYQRVEAIEADCQAHPSLPSGIPAKTPLPLELNNRIAIENELFIRRYCLFDPSHAGFARTLLEQLRHLGKGMCSDEHIIEKKAIWLALEHLDQILSRLKENAGFDRMLACLGRVIGSCPKCCKLALDWVSEHKPALRNLLLRCPNTKTRKDFSDMLLTALKYLRKHEPRLYGFDVDEVDRKLTDFQLPENSGALQGVVSGLKDLWITMHQQFRAWDDYFGLLVEIASLGAPEAHVVLREDFLKLSFDILLLEYTGARKLKHENPHYANIMRLMEKGRKFSWNKLIELIRVLLSFIDLGCDSQDPINGNRRLENGKMPLTTMEETYMRFSPEHGRARSLMFLNKILESEQNTKAARDIVRLMVLAEPGAKALADINKTILGGISIDPASLASPYLAAALSFCDVCPSTHFATSMVIQIAREVDTIGLHGGKEHLEFFTHARRIQSTRLRSPQFFSRLVLQNVPLWAPPLVMYWEECVRTGTIDLLRTLLFDHDIHTMDDEQQAEEIERIAKDLCRACVKRIQDQIVTPRRSVEIRSVDSVSMIIRHCIQTYYQIEVVEEDHETVMEAESVLEALHTLTVLDAEDAISEEWGNNDSDMNTEDSESENLMSS